MLGIMLGVICLVLLFSPSYFLPFMSLEKNQVIVYWLLLVYYVLMCIHIVYWWMKLTEAPAKFYLEKLQIRHSVWLMLFFRIAHNVDPRSCWNCGLCTVYYCCQHSKKSHFGKVIISSLLLELNSFEFIWMVREV